MFYITKSGRVVNDREYVGDEDYIMSEMYPELPKVEGKVAFIAGFNSEGVIEFGYADEVAVPNSTDPPQPPTEKQLTDTQQVMQAFSDSEIRDFEAQEERKMLAQQMTDIELAVLGGGASV